LKFGAPLPDEYLEWDMVFRTGWTLEYIRDLSMADIHNYIQIKDGRAKAGVR
jgi:hypothetical protein